MYRDDMEALRARINTLEAQVNAEQRRREAAEADAVASRALVDEQRIATQQRKLPLGRPLHAWPVVMVVAISTISCLYLGMQWSRQWHRSERLQRQLMFLHHHRDGCPARHPKVQTRRTADVLTRTVRDAPPRQVTARDIIKLQRRHRLALKSCYQNHSKNDEAKLVLRIRVRKDGTVGASSVSGAGVAFRRCLQQNMRSWRLPGRYAKAQTVEFPVVFRGR
jgi:hypothetical protein